MALTLLGLLASTACFRFALLADAVDSPEALARTVLARMTAGDRPALLSLALSEQEFREHVWPQLPAARPERNLPFSYVWKDLKQKSDASLDELLTRLRGQSLEFVRLEFTGETTRYDSLEVSRDSRVWVRTTDGAERSVRVFGSMIRRGDQYKVFSYVVD